MPARKFAEPLFVNRELSLLQFNERVLAMAERADTPLLERLRYVCIVSWLSTPRWWGLME